MDGGKIFLIDKDREDLIEMSEKEYLTEGILQNLLEKYSNLLPGDQISPENPRRWLFVGREIGVPGDRTEIGRWSLDHLFLDQDAIPTFVECKRSSDTRTRREVVAQMLDYAANGIEYWNLDSLRQKASESAERRGKSLDDEIRKLLGKGDEPETYIEDYWKQVEVNLRSGKVRLIFVTDSAPKELRRLVEFLNEKLIDVEVYAVEIQQYLGDGHRVLVPRVIGATETASETKGGSRNSNARRLEFIGKCEPAVAAFFERVIDLATEHGHIINWGSQGFSIRAHLTKSDQLASFAYGWPWSKFDFYFAELELPEEEAKKLRQDLTGFGVFEKSGEKTLKSKVNKDTIPDLNKVYDFILQRIDEISKTH